MQMVSLGGGVQSLTLFLMNLHGEIDPPAEFAVFADTGWERSGTYDQVGKLNTIGLGKGFPPIWVVKAGNIRDEMLSFDHYLHMPLYTVSREETDQILIGGGMDVKESKGQLRRQCTRHYKIKAIDRAIREEFGLKKRTQWIGFSVDELARMSSSRRKYISFRFPLIEKRMDRNDCKDWLIDHGHPVPVKSSCIGCPYLSDQEWLELRSNEREDACQFDDAIRDKHLIDNRRKSQPLYLHRSCQPLRDVEFKPGGDNLDKQEDCAGGCWL